MLCWQQHALANSRDLIQYIHLKVLSTGFRSVCSPNSERPPEASESPSFFLDNWGG